MDKQLVHKPSNMCTINVRKNKTQLQEWAIIKDGFYEHKTIIITRIFEEISTTKKLETCLPVTVRSCEYLPITKLQ